MVIVFPMPVSLSGFECDVPIESLGLKYISISSLNGIKGASIGWRLLTVDLNENTLGISWSIVDWVCEIPTNSTGLKTLNLFEKLSTSKTFTISDDTPTLNLSFVLISDRLPLTGKKVTIPVANAVPIPWVRISLVDDIPISWGPTKSCTVDESPPTFTNVAFSKFKDVDAIPTIWSSDFL